MESAEGPQVSIPPDDISKQEALRETGISYGQFYRWKRMGLIPEAWFQRRSTFTGQETFLPRQKLLERINRIQELKDRHSLEEVAEMLSPDVAIRHYSLDEVHRAGIVSSGGVAFCPGTIDPEAVSFLELVCLATVEHLRSLNNLSEHQIRLGAQTVLMCLPGLGGSIGNRHLVVVVNDGVSSTALYAGECSFGPGASIAASVDLDSVVQDLKIRLGQLTV
jgi:hypothetical protein